MVGRRRSRGDIAFNHQTDESGGAEGGWHDTWKSVTDGCSNSPKLHYEDGIEMLQLEVSRHCCNIFAVRELKERKNRRNTLAA